jgi:concanavalin A-like lectin/glucanase superfamily protein/stigma-specific protein Stig1
MTKSRRLGQIGLGLLCLLLAASFHACVEYPSFSRDACEGVDCSGYYQANHECSDGLDFCAEVCTDLAYDENNCGLCGVACTDDENCVDGVCQSIDGNTLGLWHMDESGAGTTTLVDASGFGNHLVRSDASEDVVGHPGRFGFAVGGWAHVLNIGDDRDGYFADTSLAGTSGLTELTFEFWLLLPANGVQNDPNPFGLGNDDNDRFRIDDSGSLEYDNEGIQGHLSTDILPFGTWNHVALTWDADYARIWLNGELAAQEPSSGVSAITFLRLGGQHAGNTNFSSGYVDETRLSDVVRYRSAFEPPQAPFDGMHHDCPSGQERCGGTCVDLMTDENNCGACGNVCHLGEHCTGGNCIGEACGDFSLTVKQWSWDWMDEGQNIGHIHTLLDASGPRECYEFNGFNACTQLILIWDEGITFDKNCDFKLRSCNGSSCEVGDIFQTDEPFCDPEQERQALVNLYGMPDRACGYVCNEDGIVKEYCAALPQTDHCP